MQGRSCQFTRTATTNGTLTDIFLSYKSVDPPDRVRPLHDALSRKGFESILGSRVPVGTDWDAWIRERLGDARVALVVWSRESVKSPNVRHEAAIAQEQGKLGIRPARSPLRPAVSARALHGAGGESLQVDGRR